MRLADGRAVAREAAYRDHPLFPGAAAALLASPAGDDAALGAWLLGTLPRDRGAEAEPILVAALEHRDPLAAFEAALSLASVGGPKTLPALRRAARSGRPEAVRRAAAWSARRLEGVLLPPAGDDFRRGVNWWFEGEEEDAGASSFRTLASLGVTWISIHSWDPRQRSIRDPALVQGEERFSIPNLGSLVKSAHAAGLKVMVKPHLEMRHPRPTADEMRILRGADETLRRRLRERLDAERAARGWHNAIEMESEANWRTWFGHYERYLLRYARRAQEAGADMFCVGRELDRTAALRDADWRRLIARVREVFGGPLTYSANFDSYEGIRFWDALDFIGVSAYFPLSAQDDPPVAELRAGWDRVLSGLEERSRRFQRPVLFTEVGYASVPGAARTPWAPPRGTAAPWVQARGYEAARQAVSARPWIQGMFWWLWEGVRQPPFRDADYTVQGKPAAFLIGGPAPAPSAGSPSSDGR